MTDAPVPAIIVRPDLWQCFIAASAVITPLVAFWGALHELTGAARVWVLAGTGVAWLVGVVKAASLMQPYPSWAPSLNAPDPLGDAVTDVVRMRRSDKLTQAQAVQLIREARDALNGPLEQGIGWAEPQEGQDATP